MSIPHRLIYAEHQDPPDGWFKVWIRLRVMAARMSTKDLECSCPHHAGKRSAWLQETPGHLTGEGLTMAYLHAMTGCLLTSEIPEVAVC